MRSRRLLLSSCSQLLRAVEARQAGLSSSSSASSPSSADPAAPAKKPSPSAINEPASQPSLVSSPQEPRQFYRRPLPASCIAFATAEGRQLFKEALEMGFMEAYFDLAPQLRTQVSVMNFFTLGVVVLYPSDGQNARYHHVHPHIYLYLLL